MPNRIISSILDLTREEINDIFMYAAAGTGLFHRFRTKAQGSILGSLFFQPSTRTALSFKSAFIRLGGSCIGFSDIEESRAGISANESVADTAQIVSKYCDCIILRTTDPSIFEEFAEYSTVPIISAGHGQVEHPTQALLDLFTIHQVLGRVDALNVLVIAQLPKRTMHSFVLGTTLWRDVIVHLITPPGHAPEEGITKALAGPPRRLHTWESFNEFADHIDLETIDVINIEETRADFEPLAHFTRQEPFVLTADVLRRFRRDVFITHPLPRFCSLPRFIDETPNAQYFQVAANGPFVRAALFLRLLFHESIDIEGQQH